MKTVKEFLFVGAAAIIFAVLGVALLASSIYSATEHGNYIRTAATVTHAEVWQKDGEYVVQVTYEYFVDGKRYEKQSPHVRSANSSKFEGDTLTVYYNPENPEEVNEGGAISFSVMFFGIAFTVVGGGLFAFVLIEIKKSGDISKNNKLTK
ncbi:MAG: DUF3592 domain-containing protein [Clostridia bacterium]|nr:DUF3592 domain-containing protein [Clostridia bacterium]